MYELMSKHVSIRKYKDEDIKEEDLSKILKSAQFAPSSINGQQWSIIVIKDNETKKKIATLTGGKNGLKKPLYFFFL